MPSAGLQRTYTASMIGPKGKYVFLGTSGGEICLYNIQSKVFKALLPIAVNGMGNFNLNQHWEIAGEIVVIAFFSPG